MSNPTPGVQHAMQCSTTDVSSCSTHGAGHTLSPLQDRVAAATPSKWRDAVVSHVAADGWLGLHVLEGAQTAWVWHHADLSDAVSVGEPVALHELYHTLAIGTARVNVLVAGI